MTRIIIVFISLMWIGAAFAQEDNKPLRLELDTRPNTEPFQIIPMGEHGFMVIFKTNEFEDRNNRNWVFAFYDTKMQLQFEFIRSIFRNHEYVAYAYSEPYVSLLFYNPKASVEFNMQVLSINPQNETYQLIISNLDKRFEPERFKLFGDHCFIGMNSKDACRTYRINIFTGDAQVPEHNHEGGTYIENINIDKGSGEIVVLTSFRNERRRNALFLHRFDENGIETSFETLMKGENRKMATSAEYVALNNGGYMVLGSFTSNPKRRPTLASDAEGNRSTGVFRIIMHDLSKGPQFQFYDFTDLTNFENYIRGPLAEERKRFFSRLFQRRSSSSFEHNLVMHDIQKYDDLYLLSGEAFSPDFRTVTTIAYDYYGRPVPRTYSVFDGYRYSHALVVAFDGKGRLLWDNGMEMINVRTFDLNPKLILFKDAGGLAMAFNHNGKIAWKLIRGNENIINISYANIETSFSKDRVNNEQSSRLFLWYDKYFLASGYQTIINNYLPAQPRRNVFYINKIAFD
jgi:hypothetical protein